VTIPERYKVVTRFRDKSVPVVVRVPVSFVVWVENPRLNSIMSRPCLRHLVGTTRAAADYLGNRQQLAKLIGHEALV
jgi:hypothetical protein